MKKVRQIGEWGLLGRMLPLMRQGLSSQVRVKPGDDAAVVRVKNKGDLVITTDMMVEDVHFDRKWTSGEDLGHKALAVNLSDLAGMGDVQPMCGVVSLGIPPDTPVNFVDKMQKGLSCLARAYGLDIVGGDTVRSQKIVVSITVVGLLRKGALPILRSGARIGDCVLVTGTLGDAAAGFQILKKGNKGKKMKPLAASFERHYLLQRFLRPEPRIHLARQLTRTGRMTSLMDCSDGLTKSVHLLCEASGVGARIDAAKLPVSSALSSWAADAETAVDLALTGGEDYELVMTAPPGTARKMEKKRLARVIGQIIPQPQGVKVSGRGKKRSEPQTFEHFCENI